MAMILNLSIGEEVEQDAKDLEGKAPGGVDSISPVESVHDGVAVEDEKTLPKTAEASV